MTAYTLAGGCFWCLDAVYRQLKGVESSVCGYSGGTKTTANYLAVSSGATNHAECVHLVFNEKIIPEDVVLDIFFLIHNPTTLNQQGADVGTQYRSAMFYRNNLQRRAFEQAAAKALHNWQDPIVTQIVPLQTFYQAESQH